VPRWSLRVPGSDAFAGRALPVSRGRSHAADHSFTASRDRDGRLQPLGVELGDRSAFVGISDRMRAARGLEPTSPALSTDLAWLYPPKVDLQTTDRFVLGRLQISICGMLRSMAAIRDDHIASCDSKGSLSYCAIVCQAVWVGISSSKRIAHAAFLSNIPTRTSSPSSGLVHVFRIKRGRVVGNSSPRRHETRGITDPSAQPSEPKTHVHRVPRERDRYPMPSVLEY
jgi:hypothetical protein